MYQDRPIRFQSSCFEKQIKKRKAETRIQNQVCCVIWVSKYENKVNLRKRNGE